jgi:hypothetical protein
MIVVFIVLAKSLVLPVPDVLRLASLLCLRDELSPDHLNASAAILRQNDAGIARVVRSDELHKLAAGHQFRHAGQRQ